MNVTKKVSFPLIMFLIASTNFIAMLNTTTNSVLMPMYMRTYQTTFVETQLVVTAYILATCMIAPTIGYITDRFTLRKTFLVALSCFACATFAIGFSTNLPMMIGLRAIQGIFGGMLMPMTQSMIFQIIPKEEHTRATGIWAMTNMLGPTLGPSLGGLISDTWSWQYIFFFQLPIAMMILILAWKIVPSYRNSEDRSKHPFDYQGLFLATVGSVCLLMGFSNLSQWGPFSIKTMGSIMIGFVLLTLFFYVEWHKEYPLLYVKVFQYGNFFSCVVLICVAVSLTNTSNNIFSVFVQNVLGHPATVAALILLPAPLATMGAVSVISKLYPKYGPYRIMGCILVLGIVACCLLGSIGMDTAMIYLVIFFILRDWGSSTLNMPSTALAMKWVPKEYATHASAVMAWIKQCFTSLIIGCMTTFQTMRTHYYETMLEPTEQYTVFQLAYTRGMQDYFHAMILIFLVGLLVLWYAVQKEKQQMD